MVLAPSLPILHTATKWFISSSIYVLQESNSAPAPASEPVASMPVAAEPQVVMPPPAPKALGFGDIMAFSGPGPELINGRLAMIGIVAALGAEISSNESVFAQLKDAPAAIGVTFLLFIAASLVPFFRNAKPESFGIFTPKAEMANGRAAMLGLASLILIEAVKHSALF